MVVMTGVLWACFLEATLQLADSDTFQGGGGGSSDTVQGEK